MNCGWIISSVCGSMMSTGMRTSCVCVVIAASVKRIASEPWLWIRSIGSTPLPSDFDIFCPNPS